MASASDLNRVGTKLDKRNIVESLLQSPLLNVLGMQTATIRTRFLGNSGEKSESHTVAVTFYCQRCDAHIVSVERFALFWPANWAPRGM